MADARPARSFALIFGGIYVLVGLVGFAVTGFDAWLENGEDTLLIFDVNPFHNLVHLSIGVVLLAASRVRDGAITQGVNLGVGAILVLAAVLGFGGQLPIISIDQALAGDNFLHLVSGVVAIAFGLVPSRSMVPTRT